MSKKNVAEISGVASGGGAGVALLPSPIPEGGMVRIDALLNKYLPLPPFPSIALNI